MNKSESLLYELLCWRKEKTSNMVQAIYRSPADSLRFAADQLEKEEALWNRVYEYFGEKQGYDYSVRGL